MKRFPIRVCIFLLVIILPILLIGKSSLLVSSARAATGQCGTWQVVRSPSPGSNYNSLWEVAAVSQSDIWAVGGSHLGAPGGYPLNSAIVEHWDGTRWSFVPSPEPGNYDNVLEGVAALASNDVWAVGWYQNAKGGFQEQMKTLIEHWDGKQWSMVTSPGFKTFYNSLSSVTALSPVDIWVGGTQGALNGTSKVLFEHWNGAQWSVVAGANPGTFANGLRGVTALSSGDVWAVGTYSNGVAGGRTLIEHWNGRQWSVVASPNIGPAENDLWSATAIAPGDVWAVGVFFYQNIAGTVTEHWNGSRWSIVSSPNPPGGDNDLHGVAALASNDVWAVGSSVSGDLIIHWDGRQWNIVPSPNAGFLNSVVALNPHDLWAVGAYLDHKFIEHTLIEHYC